MIARFIVSLFALTLALTPAATSAQAQEQTLTVFAAASLKNALDDINTAFTNETKIKVTASYAASSALMKQIEQGAPADVFASADLEWMDYGNQRKLVKSDTRVNLLGNRLVLIAPANSKTSSVTINKDTKFSEYLGADGRLVTGDVRAVPVGKYAKAALEKLGLWAQVEPRMAMADNVRAALALVAREEAPLGIVYETDAKVEPKVKIVGAFPEGSHEPIVYPAAVTTQGKPEAAKYIQFLRSNTAKAIFEKYGFTWLNKPSA
jgi:molybdate transport system substrate-binding protein